MCFVFTINQCFTGMAGMGSTTPVSRTLLWQPLSSAKSTQAVHDERQCLASTPPPQPLLTSSGVCIERLL